MNISGHRVSTMEVESALVDHAAVIVTGHGKVIVWLARHLPSVLAFALERGAYRSRGEPTGSR